MTYIKVEGSNSLVRDEKTNAILNTNMSDYNNYLRIKNMKQNDNKKINDLEEKVIDIKNDLDEIKQILKDLSNK